MYPLCKKKTLTVSCTLVCESGDRVKADQSSFSADLRSPPISVPARSGPRTETGTIISVSVPPVFHIGPTVIYKF